MLILFINQRSNLMYTDGIYRDTAQNKNSNHCVNLISILYPLLLSAKITFLFPTPLYPPPPPPPTSKTCFDLPFFQLFSAKPTMFIFYLLRNRLFGKRCNDLSLSQEPPLPPNKRRIRLAYAWKQSPKDASCLCKGNPYFF